MDADKDPGRKMSESDKKFEELRAAHSHRAPNPEQLERLRRIRQEFLNLAVTVETFLPQGREKSLTQTKLEEARMWACNALVDGGEIREPLTINHPNQ